MDDDWDKYAKRAFNLGTTALQQGKIDVIFDFFKQDRCDDGE